MLDAAHGHAEPVGGVEQEAEAQRRPGDDRRVAQQLDGVAVDHDAEGDDRQGGDDQVEGEARAAAAATEDQAPGPGEDQHDVAPEIEGDGEQGADVDGDVDEEALVRPAGDRRHQDQVRGRADGEELRDALDEGQHRDVDEWQPRPRGKALPLITPAEQAAHRQIGLVSGLKSSVLHSGNRASVGYGRIFL